MFFFNWALLLDIEESPEKRVETENPVFQVLYGGLMESIGACQNRCASGFMPGKCLRVFHFRFWIGSVCSLGFGFV